MSWDCLPVRLLVGLLAKPLSREIGQRIVKTILEVLEPKGIYLAVQGCEHLNRALVVERELAHG